MTLEGLAALADLNLRYYLVDMEDCVDDRRLTLQMMSFLWRVLHYDVG
jgi:hypothetical protein